MSNGSRNRDSVEYVQVPYLFERSAIDQADECTNQASMTHQKNRPRLIDSFEQSEGSFGHLSEALAARCRPVPRGQYFPGTLGLQSIDVLALPGAEVSFSKGCINLQGQLDSSGIQASLSGLYRPLKI